MEVKVNREIRNYKEKAFMGFTWRQIGWVLAGLIIAIVFYFRIRSYVELDVAAWIIMAIMIPFAAMGFVSYNGMHAGRLLYVWIRANILMPKRLLFVSRNLRKQLVMEFEEELKKKEKKQKKGVKKHAADEEKDEEADGEAGSAA